VSTKKPVIPPVVTVAALGKPGETLARESGESVVIHRLSGELASSGLLFKQYKKTSVDSARAAALDELITFGRSASAVGRAERDVLLAATSWPVTKVTDEHGELAGCLLPEAGKKFRSDTGQLREIDTLAQTDERLASRGMSVSADQRLAVSREIVQVATALERRLLVYSDWNYANALWCPDDCSVFVIDIDGCRSREMRNIYQNDWEDPLTTGSAPADTYTDRYRVALLTARCLTGQRKLPNVLHSLNDVGDTIPGQAVLLDMLWAADRDARPSSRILRAALDGADIRFPVQRMPLPPRVAERRTRPVPAVNKTKLTVGGTDPVPDRLGWPPQPAKKTRSPAARTAAVAGALILVIIVIIVIAVIAASA
jgi:hypothetical protein